MRHMFYGRYRSQGFGLKVDADKSGPRVYIYGRIQRAHTPRGVSKYVSFMAVRLPGGEAARAQHT